MNKEFAANWLNTLKEHWLSKDIDSVTKLFSEATFYQETPFDEPFTTLGEIKNEWENIKNQNIQDLTIKPLAIDGHILIAEWNLKQNNSEYSGIYEIKFNQDLKCTSFRSWEMEK